MLRWGLGLHRAGWWRAHSYLPSPYSQIRTAKATSYLLEKSRVVEHARGERSYHVLYQLCAGASAKEKEALKLPDG